MFGIQKFRPSLRPAKWGWVAGLWLATAAWTPDVMAHDHGIAESNPVNLPELGDVASQELSPAAERRLGDRIMRSIWPDPAVLDDALILEYVDELWTNLLLSARQKGDITADLDNTYAWEPFLIQDRSVNAFALPGGYIGVHLGLIAMTSTADELASVLAHEMAHVTQRHIARTISVQARQGWISLASIVLGVLAASRDPQAAQAVIMGGQAASMQGQLNFSRDMEREADRVGFGIMTHGGFAPAGMAQMFEHLQRASRLNDDGSFPYLRTHPLTTERIGEARARLGPGGWQLANVGMENGSALQFRHALMAARAKVRMDTRSAMLDNQTQPHIPPQTPAAQSLLLHYTAAMALQLRNEFAPAQQHLSLALKLASQLPPSQQVAALRVLNISQVELNLVAQQPETALAHWAAAYPRRAKGTLPRPELLTQARLALLSGPTARALALTQASSDLQSHLGDHPHDSTAWGLLGQIWLSAGQPIRAVRADAEASAAKGDLPGAIDRVLGAQKRFTRPSAEDALELSVMDARLRIWQKQHREDMREDSDGR